MKIVIGSILSLLGGGMLLNQILNLVLWRVDVTGSHELSVVVGACGLKVLILALGLDMIRRGGGFRNERKSPM